MEDFFAGSGRGEAESGQDGREVGFGGGIRIGQGKDGDVGLIGEADGDEGLGAEDFAAFFETNFSGFPIGREEFVMGVFEEFGSSFAPFDLAIEAVVAGFEGHDPAVGFLVGVAVFETGNVGMADVERDPGETAAEFSGEGMEVIDEGVSGGAVYALEAFTVREIAVG